MAFNYGATPSKGFGGTSPGYGQPNLSRQTTPSYGGSNFGATMQGGGGGFGAPANTGFQQQQQGGGGFGQQNRQTGFGGTGSPSTVGAFGTSPFTTGAGATGGFGGSSPGGFGKSPTTTNLGGAFGGGNTLGSGFGGAGGFGAQPQQQQQFGAVNTGGFGNTAAGGFGATAAPAFGAGGGGGFGGGGGGFGAATITPFGGAGAATNTLGFGAQQQQQQAMPFGATSGAGFGASTGGAFGSVAAAPFGAASNVGAFGAPAASTVTPFGAPPAGGGFGTQTVTPAFGSSTFGATPAGSTGFGGFGASTLGGQMGGQMAITGGTGNPPFAPEVTTEAGRPGVAAVRMNIQVITAMGAYANKSMEELRVEDYRRGVKGPSSSGALSGGFGGTAFGGTTPSAFGAAPAASTGMFGSSTTGGGAFGTTAAPFGASTAPAFGQQQFGQQQQPQQQQQQLGGFTLGGGLGAPVAFGTQPQAGFGSTGGFGAPTTGFGTQTAAGAGAIKPLLGGFGSPQAAGTTAPAFGSTVGAFGSGAGGFGGQPAAQFGAAPAMMGQQQQQQPAAAGGFGMTGGFGNFGAGTGAGTGTAPAAAPFGGFGFGQGATSTFGAGFGTTPAAGTKPAVSFTGFGAPAAGGVGNFTFAGLGGQQQQQFGNAQLAPFQSPNVLQSAALDHKMQYLNRKQDELEIQMKDDKLASQFHSQSQSAPSVLNKSDNSPAKVSTSSTVGSALLGRQQSRSAIKIAPRSFAPQTPSTTSYTDDRGLNAPSSMTSTITKPANKSATTASDLGATTSFLRPEGLLGRSVKKLVIAPQFHQSTHVGALPAPPVSSVKTPQAQAHTQILNHTSSMEMSAEPSSIVGNGHSEATPLRTLMNTTSDKGRKPSSGEPTGLTPFATRSPLDLNYSSRHIETPVTRSAVIPQHDNNSNSTSSAISSTSTVAKTGFSASMINSDVFHTFSSPVINSAPTVPTDKENESTSVGVQSSTPVNRLPAQPPILTMNGYETSPSMDALEAMSRDDLSHISYFSISRPQYGSIEWQSETDLNGINLDKIVRIEKNSVEVYFDEELMKDKPVVNTELNKPAIITLLNVFPKEGSSVSKVLQYESKLRATCRKNGSEFVDYNPVLGSWVFKVEHFSKYGIVDDDDDEETTAVPQPIPQLVPSINQSTASNAIVTSNTTTTNINMMAMTNITTNSVLLQTPAFINTKKLKINSDAFNSKTAFQYPSATTSRVSKQYSNYGATTSTSLDTFNQYQSTQKTSFVSSIDTNTYTVTSSKKPSVLSLEGVSNTNTSYGRSTELAEIAYGSAITPRIKRSLFEPTSAVIVSQSINLSNTNNENQMNILSPNEIDRKKYPLTFQKSFSQSELPLTYEDTIPFKKGRIQVHPDTRQIYTLYDDSYTGPEIKVRKQGVLDYKRALGTSFRVGWSADGRFVHSGLLSFVSSSQSSSVESQYLNVQRVTIETMNVLPSSILSYTTLTNSEIESIVTGPWKALFQQCIHDEENSNITSFKSDYNSTVPLWRIPIADVDNSDEYVRFLRYLKSLEKLFSDRALTSDEIDWTSKKIIDLFQASVGQDNSIDDSTNSITDIMPLLEFKSLDNNQWQRRRAAISSWLKSICVDQVLKFDNRVDDGQLGENVETYDRIFQLLSTHRIIDAIQVAENAGITQLASLLTQLKSTSTDDDSFSVAMRNQLAIWVDTNEDALMADELVNVYRILASVPTRLGPLPDKMFPYSTLTNLGWSRSIGIFYWYCYQQSSESESDNNQSENSENLEPMASALLQYKLALTDGDVDYPAPRYMTQVTGLTNHHILSSVTTQQKYTDCLYNLLEVLFGSGEGVNGSLDGIASQEELLLLKSKYAIAAMESEACTTNTMDYRSSSLILILLQCCGMIPTDLNNTQASLYPAWLLTGASIVRQHIISQLLVLGYWKWAIFVCLLIEDPFQRNFLVSDIILRYSHLSTNANKQSTDVSLASQMSENDDNEILSNEDIQMLINEFHVPSEYIHQALGYYYGSIFNIDKQIEHYNFADMNIEANEVLCEKKAPKIIIEGDSIKMNHLLQLLEAMNVECMNELLEISEEESLSINLSKSELLLYYLRIRNDVDSDVWKDIITATTTTTASDQYSSEQTAMIISVMKRASNLVLHIKKQYHQLILIKNKQKELINMSRDPSSYAYSVASAGVFEIACFHITSYLLEVLDQIHTTLFQRGSISGAVLTPTVYNLVFPPTATANSNSNTNTSIPVYDSVRMNCVLKESANIQKSSCEQVSNQIRSSLLVSCK